MRNAQTFLWMETPPLWVGNVPFADGNAAARTFGRAHRRRPYHFSCGSVSQGCRRGARRRTKTKKVAGEVLADGLKRKKVAGRGSADGQKQEMIAGEEFADKQTRGMIGGKRFADEQNAKRLRGRGV